MKKIQIIALLSILTCWGCEDKTPADPDRIHFGDDNESWECYQAVDWSCSGIYAEQYCTGQLDGQEFCINAEGQDTTYLASSITVITDNSSNITYMGNTHEVFLGDKDDLFARMDGDQILESKLVVGIHYNTPTKFSWLVIFDSMFVLDQSFPINKSGIFAKDPSGLFQIEIQTFCDIEYKNGKVTGSAGLNFITEGPQPADALIRCVGKTKKDLGTHYLYELIVEFSGNLYSDNKGQRLWRHLDNGRARMKFRVEK